MAVHGIGAGAGAGDARTVLIAPDSFKGSATAEAAAAALAEGWRDERPGDSVRILPMADGGEGTLDAVATAMPDAVRVPIEVRGPDDRLVSTCWLRLPDGSALVELAATSGLLRLETDPRTGGPVLRPRTAHTVGTGQAIRAAVAAGARRVHVALGGSASSDGGSGLLSALGVRFLDAEGRELPRGSLGLESLARVDRSDLIPLPPEGILAWTDVRSPLLGAEGAVAVFGPQKGLHGPAAEEAERGLRRLATVFGGDPDRPGAGAAGGAGFGLAAIGAEIVSGSAAVAGLLGLDAELARADAVITGEGRFDAQSAEGKVVSHVCRSARAHGVPQLLVAGRIEAETDAFSAACALVDLATELQDPLRDAPALLRRAGSRLARRFSELPDPPPR